MVVRRGCTGSSPISSGAVRAEISKPHRAVPSTLKVFVPTNGDCTDQMVADVKMWLDNPSSNHGWLLMGQDNSTVVKRFDTRENANEANRPTLILTFDRVGSRNK